MPNRSDNNINEFVKELIPDSPFGKAKDINKLKTTAVTGDKAAHSAARADVTIDRIKDNLRSMGVNASDLSDQDTIDFYKALKEFPFAFSLNKAIPGYFNGESKNIKGKASVDQRSNAKKFVMYFTHEGVVYRMNFSSKTLQKNLRGTDFDLPMLLKNNIYDVRISIKKGKPNKEVEGETVDSESPKDKGPAVPPEIKKNRNEIFRLLLKNYGGYNGDVVYGDGFKNVDEAREYAKLQRLVRSGKIDKSELTKFRDKSSRDEYSMMIANLRKSYPTTFFKKLEKAFPEFNISYQKKMDESFIVEAEENPDKYKRWSIVFGKVVGKDTIDKLDENIREFMAAVKKWFATPIKYRGKSQSYNISFDGGKVNDYWKKFYGTQKESISISGVLSDLLNEKSGYVFQYGKSKPPKGTTIGQGERWDDKEILPQYFDRKLKIISVPHFADKRGDDEEGGSSSTPRGEFKASTSSEIKNIKGTGAGTWTSDSIQSVLNNEFKSGNVLVKKSMSKKDTLILYYPGIKRKLGTDAVLISKDNIANLFLGNKLKSMTVKIGPKAGGIEDFKEEGEAKITLLPS